MQLNSCRLTSFIKNSKLSSCCLLQPQLQQSLCLVVQCNLSPVHVEDEDAHTHTHINKCAQYFWGRVLLLFCLPVDFFFSFLFCYFFSCGFRWLSTGSWGVLEVIRGSKALSTDIFAAHKNFFVKLNGLDKVLSRSWR